MAEPVSIIWIKIVASLKARRQSFGISQNRVALWLGLTRGHLSRWEAHKATPSIAKLIRWHQVLDMKMLSVPLESRNRSRWPRQKAAS